MIVLAWILFLPSGPTWPAYPDIEDCRKAAVKYQGATCESKKIFVIPPSIPLDKK